MIRQVLWGTALIMVTTMIHAACTGLLLLALRGKRADEWAFRSHLVEAALISAVVIFLSLAGLLEAVVWAAAHLYLGVFGTLEEALYFSTVTLTTLGYGDITLDEQWRLFASLEAANGIILFGWSTALIFAVVQRVVAVNRVSRPDA